jgi:hypothetical protein
MAQRYPLTISREFTNTGAVGVGFKKYFYVTGTSTLTTTYSDDALTIANTNPVIADANGRFAEMFVNDWSLVKEVLKDANDNIINGATVDPVSPSGSSTVTLNDLGVRPTSYWGLTAGTAAAYTLVANPTISAYANTQTFFFQPHVANGAAPTMAIDGLAALNLKKYSGQGTKVALQTGDLQATERYEAVNDGVDIIILNPRNKNTYLGTNAALTIATGVVTITNGGSLYAIDTESASATDDLDTINGGNQGQVIIIGSTADARDIVLKHNTGNIFNPGGINITLGVTSDRVTLMYDSTLAKWIVIGVNSAGSTPVQLVQTTVASAAASVAFTGLSSVYSCYEVRFDNIIPTTNGAGLIMQFSVDNGATFINSLYESDGLYHEAGAGTGFVDTSNNATRFTLVGFDASSARGISNTSTKGGLSGSIQIFNPASTTQHKVLGDSVYPINGADYIAKFYVFGRQTGTTAVNAIRFKMSTANSDVDNGTIASGTFKLYGII